MTAIWCKISTFCSNSVSNFHFLQQFCVKYPLFSPDVYQVACFLKVEMFSKAGTICSKCVVYLRDGSCSQKGVPRVTNSVRFTCNTWNDAFQSSLKSSTFFLWFMFTRASRYVISYLVKTMGLVNFKLCGLICNRAF